MSKSVAVEILGWDSRYWNRLTDHRDLTSKGTSSGLTPTLTTGMDGRPDSASILEDDGAGYESHDSEVVLMDPYAYLTARVWVLKDAITDPIGIRIYHGGSVSVGYQFRTDTGALSVELPGTITEAAFYGAKATERQLGGQTWWEVWVYGRESGLGGFHLGAQDVWVTIFPAIGSAAATRATTIGGIELYDEGSVSPTMSPLSLAWDDLDGTPPNHGDFYYSTKGFSTEKPGNGWKWESNIFGGSPEVEPDAWPREGPHNRVFEERVSGDIGYSVKASPQIWGSSSSVAIGTVELLNTDGALDELINHNWRDRFVKIKIHTDGTDYMPPKNRDLVNEYNKGSFGAELAVLAIVEKFELIGDDIARLTIRDPASDLYKPLNQSYPSASASPDPYIDSAYRIAPITLGKPKQVPPVLTDSAGVTYEIHSSSLPSAEGTGLSSVSEVYVDGSEYSSNSPTYSTVTAGFTLPSAASGRVTADPVSTAAATLPGICGEITARRPRVTFDPSSQITANIKHSSPEVDYEYGVYLDTPTNPSTALNWLASSIGGYWYVNRLGSVVFGQLKEPSIVLHNKLLDVGSDPRDITTWSKSSGVEYTYGYKGVDGLRTASFVEDASWPLTNDNINSGYMTFGATSQITIRVWVLSTAPVESPRQKPWAMRLIDTSSSAHMRVSGHYSDSNTIYTAALAPDQTDVSIVNLGGQDWCQVLVQWQNDGYTDPYLLRVYLAGEAASDLGSETFGGFEIYEGATIADVKDTPPNLIISRKITNDMIIGDVSISIDNAPNLSNGMGANKNWQRGSGEGGGLNGDKFSREYQFEYRSGNSLHSHYDHAVTASLPASAHVDETAAQAEADRISLMYQQRRHFYDLTIGISDESKFTAMIDSIGETFGVSCDRHGLSEKPLVLVGVDGNLLDNKIKLRFWG
jgi:hypothetical protein